MSKSGTSAPAAPNLGALEQAQTQGNLMAAAQTAGLNNVNTTSPFGISSYGAYGTGQGGIGPAGYNLNQALSPQVQGVFDNQTNLATTLAGNANVAASYIPSAIPGATNLVNTGVNLAQNTAPSGGLNFSGLASLPTSSTDFSNLVRQAQDAAYNTQEAYLQPQQAQQRSDITQQLADQGISPGTDAYDRAMGDLNRSQTFANQQAQNAAVTAGNAQQQALFGENLQSRQQGVNEALDQYQVPASVANTLANTGSGVLGNLVSQLGGLGGLANFQATGTIPMMGGSPTTVVPPNVGSLASAANQGAYNSFAAGNTINSQIGNALGSLGGSNLLFGSGGLSGALGLGNSGLLGSLFGGGGGAFGSAASAFIPGTSDALAGATAILPFTL